MIERTNFLSYPVNNLNYYELINFVKNTINKNEKHFLAVLNANKIYLMAKNPSLREAINNASIILPENAINIGMFLLRKPLKQMNVGGYPVMLKLLEIANLYHYSVYFLGSKELVLKILHNKLKMTYPELNICGLKDGYYKDEEDIINEINKVKPNILFVGMGSPKQEFFIHKNFERLNVNILIGVGGSFNVIAGIEKPAPKWTKFGLEWLYRALQDPQKFKRYSIVNTFFVFSFIKYLVFKK